MDRNKISNGVPEKNISEKILEKIKDTKPRPRWEFLCKNYSIWVLAGLSLLIASLSFATVLYMMINNDWDIYRHISSSLPKFILLTFPYFWLIFLGLFVLAAHYNFKHTKKGYKFPFSRVVLFSILISMLLGAFLYKAGLGQAMDNLMANRTPFYEQLINKRKQIWCQADKGLLAGVVFEASKDQMIIRDIEGQIWYISDLNISTPHIYKVNIGDRLRIVGVQVDHDHFQAEHILPMRGMRWMHDMHERKVKGMRIIR
ncbi:hypothetical protein K8R42_02505 [bacterium]|nr:hypothetical protein [bacterium]